jgi:hypothetical protein
MTVEVNDTEVAENDLTQSLLHDSTANTRSMPYKENSIIPCHPRPINNWDKLHAVAVECTCALLDVLPASLSTKMTPFLSAVEHNRLQRFRTAFCVPFDKSIDGHRDELIKFWQLCHITMHRDRCSLPEDLRTEKWKDFGFQGVDPSTDFRGACLLSLRNLNYLAEHYPEAFAKMVSAEYPFAVAGINITMMLMSYLGLNATTTCLATSQKMNTYSAAMARYRLSKIVVRHDSIDAMEAVFSEVYCVCVFLLHNSWAASKRNIMEFNFVIGDTRRKVELLLKTSEDLDAILRFFPATQV